MRKLSLFLMITLTTAFLAGCGNTDSADSKVQSNTKSVQETIQEQAALETSTQESASTASTSIIVVPDNTQSLSPATQSSISLEDYTLITSDKENTYDKIDLDLTTMSSTVVYSTVYNMLSDPNAFDGQVIKITGQVVQVPDPTDMHIYCACIIADATACCQSGIEFVPSNVDLSKLPANGSEITVTGIFSQYKIGDAIYVTLKDARIG